MYTPCYVTNPFHCDTNGEYKICIPIPPDPIINYNSSNRLLDSFMVLYNTNIKYKTENVVFHAANISS
jgi:hypothetical protein